MRVSSEINVYPLVKGGFTALLWAAMAGKTAVITRGANIGAANLVSTNKINKFLRLKSLCF